MSTPTAILIAAAVLLFGLIGWFIARRQRSIALQEHFGPEYERQIREAGDPRRAEAELERRAKRVERLTIRPLPANERARYTEMWRNEQARFVDNPQVAVIEADRLVEDVMRRRGYPMSDFDQRAADISVDHPLVVEHYRAAHDICTRLERGQAATEDLRQAMIHFRTLFEDLLEDRLVEVRR
ncbi:MAG TPA: hypothetical protein VL123_00555 [Candidatus Udaeobacter sp.]|nr:hypothetical protein [Candidatus Udaeobacter sp.]